MPRRCYWTAIQKPPMVGPVPSFDWSLIPAGLSKPIILAGGLTVTNVGRAIAACKPYAVDVSSGVELDKGVKDKDEMVAFIREVSGG